MSVATLTNLVYSFSTEIRNGRTLTDVLRHTGDEMGELREEIAKAEQGLAEGDDGVVGEAVDVMTCVLDFAHESGVPAEEVVRQVGRLRLAPVMNRGILMTELEGAISLLRRTIDGGGSDEAVQTGVSLALIALIDLARIHRGGITMEEIEAIALRKCEKWKRYYSNSIDRVRA